MVPSWNFQHSNLLFAQCPSFGQKPESQDLLFTYFRRITRAAFPANYGSQAFRTLVRHQVEHFCSQAAVRRAAFVQGLTLNLKFVHMDRAVARRTYRGSKS